MRSSKPECEESKPDCEESKPECEESKPGCEEYKPDCEEFKPGCEEYCPGCGEPTYTCPSNIVSTDIVKSALVSTVSTDIVQPDIRYTNFVTSDMVSTDIVTSEMVSTDIVTSDMVSTDIVTSDMVSTDILTSDMVTTDILTSDMVSTDIITFENVSADIDTSDNGSIETFQPSTSVPSEFRTLDTYYTVKETGSDTTEEEVEPEVIETRSHGKQFDMIPTEDLSISIQTVDPGGASSETILLTGDCIGSPSVTPGDCIGSPSVTPEYERPKNELVQKFEESHGPQFVERVHIFESRNTNGRCRGRNSVSSNGKMRSSIIKFNLFIL